MILDSTIETIHTLMSRDLENSKKQSEKLESFYAISTDAQKKIINNVIICICGYSLDTIINNPENISEENK